MVIEETSTHLQIGPRLRAELERRVRELEARFKPVPRDMRELAQLKEFLKVTPITEQDGRAVAADRPSLAMPNGLALLSMADSNLITRRVA